MKIYDLSDFCEIQSLPAGCCAALGNFDGVHMGHKALFKKACESPLPAVCTFSVPAKPRDESTLFITDTAERLRLFSACGIRFAVLLDFQSVRGLSPEEFTKSCLKEKLKLSGAVCGENYHFGAGGKGDAQLLRTLCEKEGIFCTVIPSFLIDGRTVSSGEIRESVLSGDVENARRFLGHPFSQVCTVIPPESDACDCNILPSVGLVFPGRGVFAAAVYEGKNTYPGAVYIGENNVGVKIFGFSGRISGGSVRLDFLGKIRSESCLPHNTEEDAAACTRIFCNYAERN